MYVISDQRIAGIKATGGRLGLKSKHQTIIPLELVQRVAANANKKINNVPATIADKIRKLISNMIFDEAVPLYISTTSGELVFVNEGYQKLVSTCEHSRKTSAVQSGEIRLPAGLMAILNEVQLTRQNVTIEENIKVEGATLQYRSRHFPVCDDNGKVIAVGGTYVDCTEKIEVLGQENIMQQRYRDFARATSDWYWEVDRDYNITYVSDRLMAITSQPGILMEGKCFEDFGDLKSHIDGKNMGSASFLDAMKPFRDQLFLMRDSEEDLIYIHLSGVPIFESSTGEFMGYRGAGTEVTSNYKARLEILTANKNLEHTLEELTNKNIQLDIASAESEASLGVKNEFLASMSHELRTPLNAIIGFAEAMKLEVFGELNSKYISYSSDIMSAGQHLLELINDVLDVAVLENGQIKLDTEAVSLKEIINKAYNLVVLRANQKFLDISEIRIAEDFSINVDERRAIQIFVNLLSNAVKFTPEGGKVGIRVSRKDMSTVELTIWDNGIGILEDQQKLIFEKFHQVTDNIYSRTEEGTGLGLHISQHLARQMGGDITVKSIVNEGSEFTVTFNLFG